MFVQPVRRRTVALIISALTLTLSACSSSGAPSASAATPPGASASTATSAAGGEGSHVTVWTLSSANKAAVGGYLAAESTTGEDPLAVYVFNKDIPGSGTSACDARELFEDMAAAAPLRRRHGPCQCCRSDCLQTRSTSSSSTTTASTVCGSNWRRSTASRSRPRPAASIGRSWSISTRSSCRRKD